MALDFLQKIQEANHSEGLLKKTEDAPAAENPVDNKEPSTDDIDLDKTSVENEPTECARTSQMKSEKLASKNAWESLFHTRTRVNEEADPNGKDLETQLPKGGDPLPQGKAEGDLPSGTPAKGSESGNPADPVVKAGGTEKPQDNAASTKAECFLPAGIAVMHLSEAIKDAAKLKIGAIYVIDGQEYAFITKKLNGNITAKVLPMEACSITDLCKMESSKFIELASEIELPEAEFMAYNISGRVDMVAKSIVAEAKIRKFVEKISLNGKLNEENGVPAPGDTSIAQSVLKQMAGAEKGSTVIDADAKGKLAVTADPNDNSGANVAASTIDLKTQTAENKKKTESEEKPDPVKVIGKAIDFASKDKGKYSYDEFEKEFEKEEKLDGVDKAVLKKAVEPYLKK